MTQHLVSIDTNAALCGAGRPIRFPDGDGYIYACDLEHTLVLSDDRCEECHELYAKTEQSRKWMKRLEKAEKRGNNVYTEGSR